MQTGSIMERTCLFFYVMLYLLFYFEAEKVKKDVKTSIYLIKMCYETCFFSWKVCQCPKSPYLCNVFFIVLDLRLTKVGVQRYSFFYAHTFRIFSLTKVHIHSAKRPLSSWKPCSCDPNKDEQQLSPIYYIPYLSNNSCNTAF